MYRKQKRNCPGMHTAWISSCMIQLEKETFSIQIALTCASCTSCTSLLCQQRRSWSQPEENLTLFHCIGMQCISLLICEELQRHACTNLFQFLCGQLVFMVEKYGGATRISAQAVGWQAGLLVSTLYCSSWCFSRCNPAQLKMLQCARMYLGFVFGNLYGN